jgi:hypothetical protein
VVPAITSYLAPPFAPGLTRRIVGTGHSKAVPATPDGLAGARSSVDTWG